MPYCVYCCEITSGQESLEHPLPECVGSPITLPPGDCCNRCNSYFSGKLDQAICEHPHLRSLHVYGGVPGKRGHLRSQMIDEKGFRVAYDIRRNHHQIFVDAKYLERDGHRLHFNVPGRKGGHTLLSRALHKAGLGCLATIDGATTALEARFHPVREYIRRPRQHETWPYLQRFVSKPRSQREIFQLARANCRISVVAETGLVVFDLAAVEFAVALHGDLERFHPNMVRSLVAASDSQLPWLLQPRAQWWSP